MIWNSKIINDIESQVLSGYDFRTILRELSIDDILSDNKYGIKFPFYTGIDMSDLSCVNYRNADIPFEYTDVEKQSIKDIICDPKNIFKYLDKFTPYKYQEDWIDKFKMNKYNLYLCSRQVGSSTMAHISLIYFLMTNTKDYCLFLTNNDDSMRRFLEIYKSLPFYLKIGIKQIKGRTIFFDNECEVIFTNKISLSKKIDLFISEEFNNFKDFDKIFNSVIPAIIASPFSRVLLYTSMLSSKSNLSIPNLSIFNITKIKWYEVPNRDGDWISNQINILGSVKSFVDSHELGDSLSDLFVSWMRNIKIDESLK